MMHRTVEWLNSNRYRRYPFQDDADMALGVGELADDVVLDFKATSVLTNPGTPALTAIESNGAGVELVFTFTLGVTTLTVPVPAFPAYPYQAQVAADGIYAAVVFDSGCEALRAVANSYTCNIPVHPTTTANQSGHRVDTVASAIPLQALLSGHVLIQSGYNCDVSVANGKIRLAAGKGLGAGRYCVPPTDGVLSCSNALLRINGATASADGNINLVVEGAQVTNDPATHTITVTTPKLVENMRCG